MALESVNGSAVSRGYAALAASIPGAYLSKRDFAGAAEALERLLVAAGSGPMPVSGEDSRADAEGNLWLMRAGHLFSEAGGDRELAGRMLSFSKRTLQEFISANGVGGVTMDHGGLLLPAPAAVGASAPTDNEPGTTATGLRLNALWYSALESTASELRKAKDPSGDHFERLAARFRRTFAKSYWCEDHNCICPPHVRGDGRHGELPDADQLLLTVLPASPVPRTKQRQLVQAVRKRGGAEGQIGILVNHPVLGRVESAVHRAWLAMGILNSADNRAMVMADAQAVLRPLSSIMAAGNGVAGYFRDGVPVGNATDLVATAEVMGAMEAVAGG